MQFQGMSDESLRRQAEAMSHRITSSRLRQLILLLSSTLLLLLWAEPLRHEGARYIPSLRVALTFPAVLNALAWAAWLSFHILSVLRRIWGLPDNSPEGMSEYEVESRLSDFAGYELTRQSRRELVIALMTGLQFIGMSVSLIIQLLV